MKINGIEYSFQSGEKEIRKEELALNNKNMELLFDYFAGSDGVLSVDDLTNAFGKFKEMDNEGGTSDSKLSDNEILTGFAKIDSKFNKMTTYDITSFMQEVSIKTESKKLAQDLFDQIDGPSLNRDTKKLLQKINKHNVVDVLMEYDKVSSSESLPDAVMNESTLWIFGTELGLPAVKEYICKPLVDQAKFYGVTPLEIKRIGDYQNINEQSKLNDFVKNLYNVVKAKKYLKTADVKVVNSVRQPFTPDTRQKMYHIPHKTKLLDTAQEYLGQQEVTLAEFKTLQENDKKYTQAYIMNGHEKTNIGEAWCAHTMMFLAEKAGMNVGSYKASVFRDNKAPAYENNFVDWAKHTNTWKPIKLNKMTPDNVDKERQARAKEILNQLRNMKEGDYIIWGSYEMAEKKYLISVDNDEKPFTESAPSHIGLLEKVDLGMGTITVIEGNANINVKGKRGNDRHRVETPEEGVNGDQGIGEYQEVNRRDGLIRKVYRIEDLVKSGYTGYIDNQARLRAAGLMNDTSPNVPKKPAPKPTPKPAPTPAPERTPVPAPNKTPTPIPNQTTTPTLDKTPSPEVKPAGKSKIEPVKKFTLLGAKDLQIVKETTPEGAVIMKLDEASIQKMKNNPNFKQTDAQAKFKAPIEQAPSLRLEKFGYYFQNRPNGNKKRPHLGLDIWVTDYSKKPASPVLITSPIEGIVISEQHSTPDNKIGNTLIILGRDGRRYAFKHMANSSDYSTSVAMPKVGSYINLGDKLGYVGATGNTAMWHLHFEVMTDEAKKKQEKDPNWQKASSESQYVEIRGNVNPLDRKEAGPIADILNHYKNKDKGKVGDFQW